MPTPVRFLERRPRSSVGLMLGLSAIVALASTSRAATRLEVRGTSLPRREVETLVQGALRAPTDSAAVSAALGTLVARLEREGWLGARATAAVDSGATPLLRIDVAEGPRFRWSRITVQAPSSVDSAALARGIELEPGGWASPDAAAEATSRALRAVADHGYPYATLGVSGWDWEPEGVALTLTGALGPPVTISRARIVGLKVTREPLAQRVLGRLGGLPYDRGSAEAARDRLAQLGLFEVVELEGLEGEGDWKLAQLVYRVREPRYNRIEGAVGVQGEAGAVGLARIELGNLLGTGRAAAVRWESRGRGVVQFEARYAEPLLFNTPVRLEGALTQDVQDTLYVRTRWGARARVALSGQERLEAGYEQERVVQEVGEVEQAHSQTTVFALERSTLEPRIGARRGTRARLGASQTFKRETLRPLAGRSARSSAVELEAEWNRPLRGAAGLALELRSAGRFSSQRVLPVFERYPVGGAASLRGHDEDAFRVDRFALSRFEWRWFLGAGSQRAFLFWDHAWMATRLPRPQGGDRFDSVQRDGLGFGLRLDTAGGLVGVDYGLEPGRAPLEGKIHLQLISTF